MFSQRMWLVSKQVFQKDSMSQSLQSKLRNVTKLYLKKGDVWVEIVRGLHGWWENSFSLKFSYALSMKFGIDYDDMPDYLSGFIDKVKFLFFQWSKWYLVFDFIEFLFNYHHITEFIPRYYSVLEEENSAYRITKKGLFVEITSDQEIQEINDVLEKTQYGSVVEHIQTAIKLLSGAKANFRNSIKESISAVEAISIILTNDKNATLWKAIKKLKDKWIHISPALEKWFSSIYWWTSEDWWIRHAIVEWWEKPSFDEAKYMLVSCSAFVNYLISKLQQIDNIEVDEGVMS